MQKRPLLVQRKNNTVTLTLNRPEKKNSLNPELVQILLQTLEELSTDETIRAVVIRGEGDKAFCSGYDIGSLPTSLNDDPNEKLEILNPIRKLPFKVRI